MEIILHLSKTTPGTYRYDYKGEEDVAVTAVYVKKHGFPGTPPQAIKVTIEATV